ncbi:hypothetical protein MMC22_010984 [Lobaria immixta]|nr:hypothetical protein [Lobaria immixta]
MSNSHRTLTSPPPPVQQQQQQQQSSAAGGGPFIFPRKHTGYPPFFSLQPTLLTRHAQLKTWSRLIRAYCRHERIFKLVLGAAALDSPLFHNATLRKRMSLAHVKEVVQFMASEEGGRRAEWIGADSVACWVFWRRPEEWAEVIAGWVEDTAQKNTVLTLYELVNGEMTLSQEFHGMDIELLQRSLNVLVKRGKAQIFGSEDQQGVKFF